MDFFAEEIEKIMEQEGNITELEQIEQSIPINENVILEEEKATPDKIKEFIDVNLEESIKKFISGLSYNPNTIKQDVGAIYNGKLKYQTGGNPVNRLKILMDKLSKISNNVDVPKGDKAFAYLLINSYFIGLLKDYSSTQAGFLFEDFVSGILGATTVRGEGVNQPAEDIIYRSNDKKLNFSLKLKADASLNLGINNIIKYDTSIPLVYLIAVKKNDATIEFYMVDKTQDIIDGQKIMKENKFSEQSKKQALAKFKQTAKSITDDTKNRIGSINLVNVEKNILTDFENDLYKMIISAKSLLKATSSYFQRKTVSGEKGKDKRSDPNRVYKSFNKLSKVYNDYFDKLKTIDK
jgi:hypothetical protein